jgi:mycothiol system anti-sigma-R factor
MTTDPCSENDADCREAVKELYVFLDGELTPEKRASIDAHLDACSPCLTAYEFHSELKVVVSQKCRTELPAGLRDRVFDALRALDS